MLSGAWGFWCIVRKRRDLYLWKNVRIHLDDVENLGAFIEFEAVLSDAETEPEAYGRLSYLAGEFAIGEGDRIARSYSDLLTDRA